MEKGGCCGPAELMKFFAYTLTDYHRVVHLDTDVLVSPRRWGYDKESHIGHMGSLLMIFR